MWAGSGRPTPKSMGQNGPLISIGTIPKKVVGIVPNIVPHIVPNKVPIALKSERNKRIFNFKYPYEYIDRFQELMDRKGAIREFYDKYGWRN